jgi:integrase/recombinase XerD
MKFIEAVEMFEKYQVTLERSENTIHSYHNDLYHFMNYLLEQFNCAPYLEDITSQDIEDYLYYLKEEKGYKASSRKRKLASLKSFYNFCHKKQLCTFNAAAEVDRIKSEQKERTYLTEEEIQQIVDAVNHRLIRLVLQTLYYTGLRISECVHLTLSDVDFDKNVIRVLEGKGRKDRIIPMNQKLKALLLDYKENWRPEKGTENFFCTSASGGLNRMYVNKIIQQTLQDLGWDKRITAHTFRHSFASNLVKKKVNIVQIQKLLGHSSLVTTSVYTHSNLEELANAVNCL